MAHNDVFIPAPPEDVFAVLADATLYAQWVVGAQTIRAADESWPEPGSQFHHTVGAGPLTIDDSSEVEEVDPPRLLVLKVRARPAGVGRVRLTLTPEDGGTRVVMEESAISGAADMVPDKLLDVTISPRNQASLDRLHDLVLERAGRTS